MDKDRESREPTGDRAEGPGGRADQADRDHLARLRRERTLRGLKLAAIALLVAAFVAFIVRNADPTRIDFLFFEREPPLIWIMLACALVGGILGFVLARPRRGFRFHREEPGGERRERGERGS